MPNKPAHVREYLPRIVMPKPSEIRAAVKDVEGLNAKLALLITRAVGTMACAYLFGALALIGLPTALSPGGEGIIAWIAQTFLQLVLLSIIMVGQTVQATASDARAERTFSDAETIMDRLDEHTAGGIHTILERIDALEQKLAGRGAAG
jgi:hypothetical protein